jgi:hypothetical protein
MKSHKLPLAIALIFLASYLGRTTGQDTAAPPATKKLYERTGNEGTVIGTINVLGEVPKPLSIDMSADPICTQLNPKAVTEWVVSSGGKLQNVFIYVKGGPLETYRFERDSDVVAVLKHQNCRYAPHVLAVRVGQPLMIENVDPTTHNTHPTPKNNQEWNQSMPPGGSQPVKYFQRPEAFIPFKDNQHPWEKAYVGVFDHPFFSISNELGSYKIEGLPPGTYMLVAWHERFGEKSVEVTIVPGEIRNLDFAFEVVEKK